MGETMRRREFVALMAASVAWPFAALAQQAERTYRFGAVSVSPRNAPYVVAMFDELRRLGFIEGQNLTVEWRSYVARIDLIPEFVAELVKARAEFMWARLGTATRFIAARDAILEALKKGPMTVSALARETGKGIPTIKSALHRHLLADRTVIRTKFGVYALAGTQSPYVSRGDAIVAALKKGFMSFQALAREINNPPSSVPQFLEPLLAKGKVIRIKRGIYALPGSAPAYIPTSGNRLRVDQKTDETRPVGSTCH